MTAVWWDAVEVSCVYLDRKVGVCHLLNIIKFLEALISIVLWWHIQIESMLGILTLISMVISLSLSLSLL